MFRYFSSLSLYFGYFVRRKLLKFGALDGKKVPDVSRNFGRRNVQKVDSAIHWVNLYPVNSTIGFHNTCTYLATVPRKMVKSKSNRLLLRACLHGGGEPQIGEVACGGSPHLSSKRDQIKMRDYMDRQVTPPKRVTSPTCSPPPPCRQTWDYKPNFKQGFLA